MFSPKELILLFGTCTSAFLIGFGACQHSPRPVDTPILCTAMKPVEYVDSDSDKTKNQIIVNNAVWDYYCGGGEDE